MPYSLLLLAHLTLFFRPVFLASVVNERDIRSLFASNPNLPIGLGLLEPYVPENQRQICNILIANAYYAIKMPQLLPNRSPETNPIRFYYDCILPIVKDDVWPLLRVEMDLFQLKWSVVFYYLEGELCILIMDEFRKLLVGGQIHTMHTQESLDLSRLASSLTCHRNFNRFLENFSEIEEERKEISDALKLATLNLPHVLKVSPHQFETRRPKLRGVRVETRTPGWCICIGIDEEGVFFQRIN